MITTNIADRFFQLAFENLIAEIILVQFHKVIDLILHLKGIKMDRLFLQFGHKFI